VISSTCEERKEISKERLAHPAITQLDDKNSNEVELKEKQQAGNGKPTICQGQCHATGMLPDQISTPGGKSVTIEKRFEINHHPAQIYDEGTHKLYDFLITVVSGQWKGIVWKFGNDK
jgi:hypothetical protein